MRIRQPRAAVVALILAVAAGTAACNPDPTASGEGGEGPETAPFVVARTADIDGRDPATATAFQTVQTLGLVYDTLLDTGSDGELEPGLATEWEVSDDGTEVTLQLRDGVTFHDGADFTAEDAKATLERVLDPDTGSVVASNLGNVKTIEAPDDTTLVISLSNPDASLLNVLSQTGTSILDSGDIEDKTVGREVNGTGPFAWEGWKQGQQVTLTASDDYWGDAPTLETVELRVIPDESSILSGMRAGSFDLGIVTDPSVAQQVGEEEAQVISQPTLSYHVLQLNAQRGPLTDVRVRQAIACAIDREQVVEQAYFGEGEVTGPITSPAFDYDATEGLPCDPPDLDTARSLLEEAGEGDGFSLDTIVMTGEYATASNIAQSVQGQLQEIGVDLQLQQQETNVYVDNWLNASYDAAVALNGGSTDPYVMYGRYFGPDASLAKPAGLADEGLARLLTEGNSTTDEDERQQVFGELQSEMLDLSPWVWLQHNQSYYLLGSDVQGFEAMTTESLDYLAETTREGSG
jgi:peptide/nickel transport system substrate-binding protein